MIKTKLFSGYFTGTRNNNDRKFIDIDTEINDFLASNKVEIIDIKYAIAVGLDGESWNNALMIYKEN